MLSRIPSVLFGKPPPTTEADCFYPLLGGIGGSALGCLLGMIGGVWGFVFTALVLAFDQYGTLWTCRWLKCEFFGLEAGLEYYYLVGMAWERCPSPSPRLLKLRYLSLVSSCHLIGALTVAGGTYSEPGTAALPFALLGFFPALLVVARWRFRSWRLSREAIPHLVAQLRKKTPLHRLQAAEDLGRIAPKDPMVVEALIAALDDDENSVRNAAARALHAIGEPARLAIPTIRQKLFHPEGHVPPDLRFTYRQALRHLDPGGEQRISEPPSEP